MTYRVVLMVQGTIVARSHDDALEEFQKHVLSGQVAEENFGDGVTFELAEEVVN